MIDGVVTETERLRLRRLITDDAPFILRLLNDDGWLRFIGDKNVRSLADARRYLEQGPLAMYARHGMGLWLTERKADAQPVGLCGLIRRDGLDDVDIGFAFLPEFRGEAYAYEAASATLAHGRDALNLCRIVAIASQDNERSANLLRKIGLSLQGHVTLPGDDEELSFFAVDFAPRDADKTQIDALTAAFFGVFTADADGCFDLERLHELFIPKGLIVKSCGADFEAYDLALFIAPRRKLLEDGTLTEFGEWEVSERTEVLGQVAQRMSIYRKRGRLQGVPFDTHGVKSLQFVKTPAGWRIAALAWDDEREGLELPRRLGG